MGCHRDTLRFEVLRLVIDSVMNSIADVPRQRHTVRVALSSLSCLRCLSRFALILSAGRAMIPSLSTRHFESACERRPGVGCPTCIAWISAPFD